MIFLFKLAAITAIILVAGRALYLNYPADMNKPEPAVREFFVLYTALYIFLSFLITGVFVHPPEQYLYVLNLVVIVLLFSRKGMNIFVVREIEPVTWIKAAVICVAIIMVLAVIAMNSHGEMHGSQMRFGD